jgi:hypothetical protein
MNTPAAPMNNFPAGGASTTSTRMPTPYFAGGPPNRNTLPIRETSSRPTDAANGMVAGGTAAGGIAPNAGVNFPNASGNQTAVNNYSQGNSADGNRTYSGQTPTIRVIGPPPSGQPTAQSSISTANAPSIPDRRYGDSVSSPNSNIATASSWRESTTPDPPGS